MMDLLIAFAALAISATAWREARSLRGEVRTLRRAVVGLQEQAIAAITTAPTPRTQESAPPAPAPTESASTEVSRTEEPLAPRQEPERETIAGAASLAPAPSRGVDLEQTLLGRWSVWLGAVALAFGGVFLVKYTIDRDLLGPGLRVIVGLLLGGTLTGAGELLRSRVPRINLPHVAYLPPAVTAAGIATLFASTYAAHALYSFIGSAGAFVSLAAICALAVVLSLRQGPFIALLGLGGAFIVPALVHADKPSAWTLFGYLIVVMAGSLALARDRGWWWLAWTSLAGGLLWSLIWIGTAPRDVDPVVLPGFIVLAAALFFMHRSGEPEPAEIDDVGSVLNSNVCLVWSAAAAFGFLMLVAVAASGHAAIPVVATGALIALYLFAAWRDQRFDHLPIAATVLALAVIASWAVPMHVASLYGAALSLAPEFPPLMTAAAAFAALIGLPGYLLTGRVGHPQRWSVASASAPVLLLVGVYVHRSDALGDLPWATIALAIAALQVFAASRIARIREQPGMEAALACYALSAVAAVALAFTMSLERGWLTTALALLLPALGWIAERTRVATLRKVALVVAAIVVARLAFNRDLMEMPVADSLVFNWILYSYGLPCLAFALASRLFPSAGRDGLLDALEGCAVAIALALVALEIRHAFAYGSLLGGRVGAGEIAAYSCVLLAAAGLIYRHANRSRRSVFVFAAPGAAIAACAFVVIGPLLAYNPLLAREPVGGLFLFNLLLPLYAVPLVLALDLRDQVARAGQSQLARGVGTLCLVLGFTFVSLSVRHAFHGGVLDHGGVGDAESYAYSVAWLSYGALLLAIGVVWDNQPVRYAGLAVLTLAVAKTFIVDMSVLAGLYRAASFLGLGASLLGIGYLYQRLVRAPAGSS